MRGDSLRKKDSPRIQKINCISQIRIQKQQKYVNNVKNLDTGEKFFARCTINGKLTCLLLDTGSQVSALPLKLVPEKFKSEIRQADYNLVSYSGNPINVHGLVDLDIRIGEIQLRKVTFFIVSNDQQPILGTPAITENRLEIDLFNRKLKQYQFLDEVKKSKLVTQNEVPKSWGLNVIEKKKDEIILQLAPDENTTISALSEKIVLVSSRFEVLKPGNFAIEISSVNTNFNVLVAKSLSAIEIDNKPIPILVCNPNDFPVKLVKGNRLVNATEVDVIEPVQAKPQNVISTDKIKKILQDIHIGAKNIDTRKTAEALVTEFADIFAEDGDKIIGTPDAIYNVDTGNSPPIAQQKYKTPHYLRGVMDNIIQEHVKNGIMEPTSSPWAAPVLLVKKKNNTFRLVCDYRKLNAATISDNYPLPLIEDLVTSVSKSRSFSSSDLFSGFHQIPCSIGAKERLAITSESGQFTWTKMPMGSKNCPAVFQRLMDKAFRAIPKSKLIIYLDDLLVHAENDDQNIVILKEVFQTLRKSNLKLRASKTKLLVKEVEFCGFILKDGNKVPNSAKVQAVRDLKIPASKTEAQSIFGLLNYHRAFIPNFAAKASEITKTYNGQFKWTPEAHHALQKLKSEICDAALQLKLPDVNKDLFVLETDASKNGFGACLFVCKQAKLHSHHGPRCLRPIEYISKNFTPAQMNYCTMEKELLAGREALNKWSHFLQGRKFIWRTDNACLTWAARQRSTNQKISSWLSLMSEYDYEIQLRPSKTMKVTDCLSRQFSELNQLRVTKSNLADLQNGDPILNLVRNYISTDRWPINPIDEIQPYLRKREKFVFGRSGELLLRDDDTLKIIPPQIMVPDLLRTFHDKNGHAGERVCQTQMTRNYFWPEMNTDIKEYIRTCSNCQAHKPNLHPRRPPQGLFETPKDCWEFLSFDLIGPMHLTENGNKYALVGTDIFSKRIYAIALEAKNAWIIKAAVKRIICSMPRKPKVLLTDNGTEFFELTDLCDEFKMTHRKSPAYYPQTNGSCERINQTLKNRLYASDQQTTWDDALDEMTHVINSAPNATTKLSPFEIETGHPGSNFHEQIQHEYIRKNIESKRECVKTRIEKEKMTRTNKFDKPKFNPFLLGELVLMKNLVAKVPRFIGPLKIVEVRGSGSSYKLEHCSTKMIFSRHASHLKKFYERDTEPEILQFESDENIDDGPSDQESDENDQNSELEQNPPFVLYVTRQGAGSPERSQNASSTSEESITASTRTVISESGSSSLLSDIAESSLISQENNDTDQVLSANNEDVMSSTESESSNEATGQFNNPDLKDFVDTRETGEIIADQESYSEDASTTTVSDTLSDASTVLQADTSDRSFYSASDNSSHSEPETDEVVINRNIPATEDGVPQAAQLSESVVNCIFTAKTSIYDLSTFTLKNLAKKYNLSKSGGVNVLAGRIAQYAISNDLEDVTIENHVPFITLKFLNSEVQTLHDLNKESLWALCMENRIKPPCPHHKLIRKSALKNFVDYHLRLVFPNHAVNDEDVLVFPPNNV